jgi:hypothetical protein
MKDGFRAVVVSAPVLRKNQIVSNRYTIPAAISNVGDLFSHNSLLNSEPTIPTSISNNLPATGNSNRTGLQRGWLKKHPQIVQTSFNRFQVTQEFQYGNWITDPAIYSFV